MDQKLDFSLPQAKKRHPRAVVVLLVLTLGLGIANLVVLCTTRHHTAAPSRASLDLKALAVKLSQRNLYEQAALAWQEYLTSEDLSAEETAKALFETAIAHEKAGQYAKAVECFYRSEMSARLDDLDSQISIHVKDCLERLGRFSALRYELMDRTGYKKTEDPASTVVAELGPEKISEADLSGRIERTIDNQLAPMAAFMTGDQILAQRQKAMEQYKSQQARQQFLNSWLAQEVLYRQALEDGLADKPAVKQVLDDVTQGVLAQQLMSMELASKIHITDTDIQTYYEANKGQYMEPAKARIRHILVGDEQAVRKVQEQVKAGDDFTKLAAEFSQDQATKDKGGLIESPVSQGQDGDVPGIGPAEGMVAAIFQAEAPAVLDKAFKTEKGWEVVRVESIDPAMQKPFDQVRQDVVTALSGRKRQDVQEEYIQRMMDKFKVVIHTSAFAPPKEKTP